MSYKILFFVSLLLLLAFTPGGGHYKDGTFRGISQANYTDEPYYGISTLTIRDGKFVRVEFSVRDSAKQVTFDQTYEKYFAGNELYMQQCRNDWKGICSYPDSLLKYQDPDKVDGISGATWSYNLFQAATKEALKQAEK